MNENDVKFEEEEVMLKQVTKPSLEARGLYRLIIGTGLAKNETQANYVLVSIMVICLLATIYVISRYL